MVGKSLNHQLEAKRLKANPVFLPRFYTSLYTSLKKQAKQTFPDPLEVILGEQGFEMVRIDSEEDLDLDECWSFLRFFENFPKNKQVLSRTVDGSETRLTT